MTELEETALRARLRALKVAPPSGDFEPRLLQALQNVEYSRAASRRPAQGRRFVPLVAAGVMLVATSAAAWFTGLTMFAPAARPGSGEERPESDKSRRARRPAFPRRGAASPVLPIAGDAPEPPKVASEPQAPLPTAAPDVSARDARPPLRARITRERATATKSRPLPQEPATSPPQAPRPQTVELVKPERLQISAPLRQAQPIAPEVRDTAARAEERGREIARERLERRDASPEAHTAHEERARRERPAREHQHTDRREDRGHPSKN